jgi:NADH-quinone oxidoreductase subunit A
MSNDPFWPLLLYFALVLGVVAAMLLLPALLGERHWRKPGRGGERGTNQPYESGITPTGNAKLRVPLQYYRVAMLFVIFDLEAVYLYGWAVAAREAGWRGFVVAGIFIALLLVALVYLWRVGALDWRSRRERLPAGRVGPRDKQKEEQHAMVA